MLKVCILTSVHPRYDTRIYLKQAKSLSNAGYNVTLVVADGKGHEVREGIEIFDVGTMVLGRIGRMTMTSLAVFLKALNEKADIYHFHDPELIPVGLLLRIIGKKVIYDVHEDLPRQTMSKHYLPNYVKRPVAMVIEVAENIAAKFFTAICTATPHIRNRFKKKNENTYDINNFPILTELESSNVRWGQRKNKICYIGGIAKVRGIVELIDAMEDLNCELDLAGGFSPDSFRDVLTERPGWAKVNELGYVNRCGVKSVLASCRVGVVTLHPIENYLDSLPVKMFEYMAAGIPFVASDFPLWREIIEKYNCGICVDPIAPKMIVDAVTTLLSDDEFAAAMGANGLNAVRNKYNWNKEEAKLLQIYNKFIS